MFIVFILFAFLSLCGAALAENGAGLQQAIADSNGLPVQAEELNRFYALRAYQNAWNLSDESAIKKTLAFIGSVEALADYHGLDKAGYQLDAMRQLAASGGDTDKERLELLISASLLRLAHDLHGDSVDLNALYMGWNFHRRDADIPVLLNAAIANGTLSAFFDKIAPQNAAYRDLAKALQIYSAIAARGHWPVVKPGPSLRPQDQGPRVRQLRARLAAEEYVVPAPAASDDILDNDLDKVLIDYQLRNGLSPDGIAGTRTQEALNMPVAERVMQIRVNMERWRHMPENFPPARYMLVNIPAFTATITEDGKEVYRGQVVDGRVDRPTPFINSRIYNMVVNPSWHVPLSIARKDIFPKLRDDPHYLERLGIVIAGREKDPSGTSIDWKKTDPDRLDYQLRQEPGDMNSLGQLKFNFSNPFDVYMHGTPHQELFAKAERSFSSGCVRLEEPARVGEILLEYNKDEDGPWDQQRIEAEIEAGETRIVTLAKPMPLYFLYWTVFTGEDGRVNFRKDLYGYDSLLMENKDALPSDGT